MTPLRRCRQCGAPSPTLQRYGCALCGFSTPEAEANRAAVGDTALEVVDPLIRARLRFAVERRLGRVMEAVRR